MPTPPGRRRCSCTTRSAALEWADLIYAMDLNGMNSSITPLSLVVQRDRPEKWLNWHAARMLDMIKGSYLFEPGRQAHHPGSGEPARILDPPGLRLGGVGGAARRGAVSGELLRSQPGGQCRAWARRIRGNWPRPQLMRFYVKGGPHSHGQHGYIVSNANWDPYPMANQVESFVIALANMDIAVMLRIERFRNPFFTGVDRAARCCRRDADGFTDYTPVDLQQEIQSLTNPVAPFGSAIVGTVEDLQSQTRIKLQRARQAVATTFDLLGFDLLEGSLWMDVRKTQDPKRDFGGPPTAVWTAFRQRVPLRQGEEPAAREPGAPSTSQLAAQFLRTTPAATFFRGAAEPAAAR